MTFEDVEKFMKPLLEAQREEYKKYPHGQAYDNLFNADERHRMIERHGATSAEWTTVEELRLAE